MGTLSSGIRYKATPEVRKLLRQQGRMSSWLASQIGFTKGHMSHVLSARRSISETDARIVSALLGGAFFVLFECSDDHVFESQESRQEAIAP